MGDKWSIPSEEKVEEYRKSFGAGFSPELLNAELLTAVLPNLSASEYTNFAIEYPELGYTVSRVSMQNELQVGSSVLLPSFSDPRRGLAKYGSDSGTTVGFSNYYEGIFSANRAVAPEQYSVISVLYGAPDGYSVTGITEFVRHYREQFSFISQLRLIASKGADEEMIRRTYTYLVDEAERTHYTAQGYPLESAETAARWDYSVFSAPSFENSLSYRYVYSMSPDERSRIHALMDNLPLYDEYVENTYLGLCEKRDKFIKLAYEIIKAEGLSTDTSNYSFADIHNAVDAVTAYLSAYVRYTLEPKAPAEDRLYENAAETFLFDTKEGYCVQYATAAAMLLRSLDIPCRYAEGYLANEFYENASPDRVGRYVSEIPDSNAHAWIEVYYEGFGWLTYEVTAPFVESGGHTDTSRPSRPGNVSESTEAVINTEIGTSDLILETEVAEDTVTAYKDENVTEFPDDSAADVTPDGADGLKLNGWVVFAVAVGAVLMALLAGMIAIKRDAASKKRRRRELIKQACSDVTSNEQRLECAKELGDAIMDLLARLGLVPNDGELASKFALRVDGELCGTIGFSFANVLPTIQEGEFSEVAASADLKSTAQYYDELYAYVSKNGGRINLIYVKYFLHRY